MSRFAPAWLVAAAGSLLATAGAAAPAVVP